MAAFNAPVPFVDDLTPEDLLPKRMPKQDQRSALIRAREIAAGRVINACRFGCADEGLDANGYCHHLVGFTDPKHPEFYQPRRFRPHKGGGTPFEYTDGTDPQPIEDGDKVVRISTCSRVYRNTPAPALAG